jgi:lipoate---protein ligase
MIFVDNNNVTDPHLNLALEEYLIRHVRVADPILLFYINEPAVIIGRNQNTVEEIDPDFIKDNGIHVVRRLSGGGAVYHDLGNLNFSFITNGRSDLHNFEKFTDPVANVLAGFGIKVTLQNKSSLFANGKKVSGNAQYATADRMFSHGTLLFDTSVEMLLHALNPRQIKIESKAVQSVRSYVTNLRDLLPEGMDIHVFKQVLLDGIFSSDGIVMHELTDADWAAVEKLAAEQYRTWEWNYGRSPKYNIQKTERFQLGKVDMRIDVEQGLVQGIKIFGDFAGLRVVSELEQYLIGCRYDRDAITERVQEVDLTPYFGGLTTDEFVQLVY